MTGNPPRLNTNQHADYQALLGKAAWQRLHPDIRKRFSYECKLNSGINSSVVYKGVMGQVSMSWAGKLLAQLCRLIGTPLALHKGTDVPVTVKVYPNKQLGGMTWDRFYYFPNKAVNRVKSTKCIRLQAGLIELVGFGFGMHLKATEVNGAINFASAGFFWQVNRFKIPIPDTLSPGKTTVVQTALDNGWFRFDLDVVHSLLGHIFKQTGEFCKVE